MPWASWNLVSDAFIPPEDFKVFPPAIGIFSKMTGFIPASLADKAAAIPAPPAPTMTISY